MLKVVQAFTTRFDLAQGSDQVEGYFAAGIVRTEVRGRGSSNMPEWSHTDTRQIEIYGWVEGEGEFDVQIQDRYDDLSFYLSAMIVTNT